MITLEVISQLVSFFTFTVIGLFLSKKFSLPKTGEHWVVWIAVLLLLGYIDIGNAIWLISGFGLTIYLNTALQGCGFGILVGFLIRSFVKNGENVNTLLH